MAGGTHFCVPPALLFSGEWDQKVMFFSLTVTPCIWDEML